MSLPIEEPDEDLTELTRLLLVAKYGDKEIPPEQSAYALPSRLRLLHSVGVSPFTVHVSEIRTTVGIPKEGIESFRIPDAEGMAEPWDKWRGRVVEADTLALWWLDVHRIKAMAEKLGSHPRDITMELWWGESAERLSERDRRRKALPLPDSCPPGTPAWFVDYLGTRECLPKGVPVPDWLRIQPRTREQVGRFPESSFDDFILRLAEVYHLPVNGLEVIHLYVLTGDPCCFAYDKPLEYSIDADGEGHFTITIKGDYHTSIRDIEWLVKHEIKPLLFGHLIARGRRSIPRRKGLPTRRPSLQLDPYVEFYEMVRSKGYTVDKLLDAASLVDAGKKPSVPLLEDFVRRNRPVLGRSRERLYEIVNQLDRLMRPDPTALKGDY